MQKIKLAILNIITAMFVISCSSNPEKTLDIVDQVVEDLPKYNELDVSKSTYDALLPNLDEESQPLRFDVVAKRNPAKIFFLGLVDGLDVNILVHPDIKQNITLNLKNVTLEETLEAIRDNYELEYVKTNYGYQIVPKTLQNKVFHLNYLNVSRQGSSGMSVSSGHIYDSGGSEGTNDGNQNLSTATRLETQANTDFWKSLQQSVQVMVGNGEGRRVIVDAQAGLVVVRAFPSELMAVEEFLSKAELSLQKQVIIEAKILEVTLNDGFQAGIQWDSFGAGIGASFSDSSKDSAVSLSSANITNPDSLAGIFSLNFNTSDFTGVIQLLQRQGEVQVLSSPRISTVNNQKAVIKVGTDEFFVTNVSTNTTTTTTSTNTSPEVGLTPFFSGIALDVTPQIGSNNEVILHVHPSVTEVVERSKVIEVGGNTFELPMAFSSIRETDSIIKARNGQVVVIGGLLQNKKKQTDAKVPWLSRIPLVGALFTQKQHTKTKSELVILLQPTITDSDVWAQEIDKIKRQYPSWKNKEDQADE
ncbi:pilus (MSHA type) biogenesis protein MshL [Oceaniserpentilla sp. 4NH20-0058]|uniref:pilus (MSHA type) biogenesis protein MshL n=1 Tax=Oceaniserpentilla sp. 4NH20-0058 TaxID=3127660 RepID=UPI003102F661